MKENTPNADHIRYGKNTWETYKRECSSFVGFMMVCWVSVWFCCVSFLPTTTTTPDRSCCWCGCAHGFSVRDELSDGDAVLVALPLPAAAVWSAYDESAVLGLRNKNCIEADLNYSVVLMWIRSTRKVCLHQKLSRGFDRWNILTVVCSGWEYDRDEHVHSYQYNYVSSCQSLTR